ncbi:MAG TPA: lactate permease LctP family transporter [Verrucomicrobiae bacterium]|nr:lactate permease LctP family transporter [Verrucomicrobiae bacterium]
MAHSIGWSALFAAMPMLVLLFLLGIRRKPAWISAIASLVTAILMVWFVYRMPPGRIFSATTFGMAFGLLPIGWITFNALLLYRVTVETGQFEVIKNSLAMLTSDCRLQALLIAFAFGAFIEGAAGSGVPVAVCAAMLAGMGFNRLKAAGICLLANTAPVAFGAIGLPILVLAKTTGLPLLNLSATAGRICAPLSLCVPAYMVVLVTDWKGLRGALRAVLVCGVSFAIVQVTVSNLIGPEITDILAAITAITSLVLLFRVWQPKELLAAGGTNASSAVVEHRYHSSEIVRAWLPYALLAVCVLCWGMPGLKTVLLDTSISIEWPALHRLVMRMPPVVPTASPYDAIYSLDWLASAGTACLIASVLAALFAGLSPVRFARVFRSTLHQMFLPLVTIVSVLGMAFLMNYSGATATLGLAFAATGGLFSFFSPLLGWMGVFLTGSDASSNALFGNLQTTAARQVGLNPTLIAAANSTGGVMGKMISVQSIAVAAAATGMKPTEESRLFRFTFWHSVLLVCLIGIVTTLYAYVMPWMVR